MSEHPLADKLRPTAWEEFQGLTDLEPNLLRQLRSGVGRPPSLILWGPPGCGKTTFARLVGRSYRCKFIEVSAVMVGVKEVREIIVAAKEADIPTILFVDEIHRFNKGQQDAFLPHVEQGTVSLIGATTENPSFYCTGALLSRCKVVVFPGLSPHAQDGILQRGLQEFGLTLDDGARRLLVDAAAGDARKLLNMVEFLASVHPAGAVPENELRDLLKNSQILFHDRGGEEHYNVVSAFIKSMRGSDPDAALYWGFRMLEAGEDPRFVIRRMMIFASEDIGNADPRALQLAVATADAFDRVGLPEGRIPIAHCITYLACAPKSNRSYLAMHKALDALKRFSKVSVPPHLRNAPTKLMKELGYGREYDYPHDHAGAHVAGVQYLPDQLKGEEFYEPSERGLEIKIKDHLLRLRGQR